MKLVLYSIFCLIENDRALMEVFSWKTISMKILNILVLIHDKCLYPVSCHLQLVDILIVSKFKVNITLTNLTFFVNKQK